MGIQCTHRDIGECEYCGLEREMKEIVTERNRLRSEKAKLREALEAIVARWKEPVAPTADELFELANNALKAQ